MERRVRGNSHARCGVGENPEIASKDYLSLFPGAFSSGTPKGEDFRIVLEEIVRIKCDSVSVPRPDSGRWESAGRILLGACLLYKSVANVAHFGKVSQLSYNAGRGLSVSVSGYSYRNTSQSLPKIISTGSSKASIAAVSYTHLSLHRKLKAKTLAPCYRKYSNTSLAPIPP